MTRNRKQHTTSIKHILALLLALLMCVSLVFAAACAKEEAEEKIPSYTYTEVDSGELTNPSFVAGTAGTKYTSFPKTTINGWSITKDSSAKSGAIDVTAEGWKELMNNAYSDNGLLNYIKARYGFDNDDIKDLLNNQSATATEIKEYIINHYLDFSAKQDDYADTYAFKNPGVREGATDTKIYMLNNYKNGESFGSIQTLTSTKTISLEKGQFAKVSVYVKTANINTDETLENYGKAIGANIRVQSAFASHAQNDFGIYNIVDTEWTQYSFYVKADDVYDTTFTVSLGLGYNNYKAEGTAYFDDVIVELVDTIDVATTVYKLKYNDDSNDNLKINASDVDENKLPLYDMSVDFANIEGYTNSATFDYTAKANVSTQSVSNLDAPYSINNGLTINLSTPTNYYINLFDKNGNNFVVGSEQYTAVSFFVKNELNDLYNTGLTINAKDINGEDIEHRYITTINATEDAEWQIVTVIVKNNFPSNFTDSREFYLQLVIGPDSYKDNIDDYALGTIQITNAFYSAGSFNQYVDEEQTQETPNYDYFTFYESQANGSTPLHAGSSSDFKADEADTTVYNLTVAPSDLGAIYGKPAQPMNFTGIPAGHFYIDSNSNKIDVNTNKNSGLINSNYLNNYPVEVKDALNYNEEASIQPLMINTHASSYGYIGTKYTIESDNTATISVRVRVASPLATAYIYLVEYKEDGTKEVMTFDSFKVNTTVGHVNNFGTEVAKQELVIKVTNNMMEDDGWTTVNFHIATGASAKSFRLELWSGARDLINGNSNTGYVFFNEVKVTTSGNPWEEPKTYQNAFDSVGNPLTGFDTDNENNKIYIHQRELTDLEKAYNADSDKTGSNVSYPPKYIWAKSDTMIYAVYNTIDPVYNDPYDKETTEETEEEKEFDAASFWLSLSSIILAAVLLMAIIMLVVKNVRRRMKANASDAKSHFKVVSRARIAKSSKSTKKDDEADEDEIIEEVIDEDTAEEVEGIIETEEETPAEEQTLDEFVYGDVQTFGEEPSTEETSEQADDNKTE